MYRRDEIKFQHGKFLLGDVRELIKEIPTGSINMILTDPPFGLNMDRFDDENLFFELEDEMYRVLKPNSWLAFYYLTKRLYNAFRLKKFKYVWMIICKFEHTYSRSVIGDRAFTPIMIFKKGKPKVLYRRGDVLPSEELPFVYEKVRNPQFKPTITTSMLLQMFSSEGDLVLDPFAGFGSIPLICEIFNRRWIAFEIDKRKYDIAVKFIKERKVGEIKIENNKNVQTKLIGGINKHLV